MTEREQIATVRHVPLFILKKWIKHHKRLPEIALRLMFIQLRYRGMSVVIATDTVGVSTQTGYNWQEHWNAEKLPGLTPKYAGGRPSRLTIEQKTVFRETWIPRNT